MLERLQVKWLRIISVYHEQRASIALPFLLSFRKRSAITPIHLILYFALVSLFSCYSKEEKTLFNLLEPKATGLDFYNLLEEDDTFNIIEYLYFYNGGGVAVGDLNNDGYSDIYFSSNRNPNKLYLNQSNILGEEPRFREITTEAGVGAFGNWSTGVSIVDINADGWLDIYLCQVAGYKSFKGRNQLFINQGCNQVFSADSTETEPCIPSFIENAASYGLDYSGFASQAAFFDYDLDGDLDMYLLCHSVHSAESYRDITSTRLRNPDMGDRLYENKSGESTVDDIKFVDVSTKAGIFGGIAGYGLGLAIGDMDNNGYPDIYVGNDFHENDFLYLNQGDGTFKEIGAHSMNHTSYFSMGNDLADVNNDGWLDLMTLDMKPEDEILFKSAQGPDPYDIYRFKRSFGYHHQFPQNALQINLGNNVEEIRFSESSQMMGVAATDWSWSVLIADYDLDGWKDLYITNGIPRRPNNLDYLKYISNREIQENASDIDLAQQMPSGKVSNYVFKNMSGNRFENQTSDWGMDHPSVSHGAAYADFDLDGDLDIVVNNLNAAAFFYRNNSKQLSNYNYLMFKFKGPAPNPFGIGTSVSLHMGDSIQYQELYCTRGWQSSLDHSLFFGLNTNEIVDSAVITWPDKKSEKLVNIKANQILIPDHKNAENSESYFNKNTIDQVFTYHTDLIPFVHKENQYFDNTREPLMPYLLSTQGPKLAIADVNNDQLQDLFVGGASGQSGVLFFQRSKNVFERQDSSIFLADKLMEDIGLAFLDADGDGDQDLYIGSGGNQYYKEASKLADRLYLNDGNGSFSKSKTALPDIYEQTSCVKPYDFDSDGDVDIFVGSRCVSSFYGRSPDSYLLVNDGMGHFESATMELIDLTKLGMVTDATWTDVNLDGLLDLVVVGDWMPITVFTNKAGSFEKSTPPKTSNGWWNAVIAADIDKDGDEDLILGNLGLNSNLQATETEPVNLYISDFDANLTPDPIVTYHRQGKEFPILNLDILGSQMVFLKKKFRSYDLFATKPINEIFTEEQLNRSEIRMATRFQSSIAVNDGKGNFNLKDLPGKVQNSSVNAILVFDLNQDQIDDILLAGNFYDLQPAIGRLDASFGNLLLGTAEGWFKEADTRHYNLNISGQVRDLQFIETGDKRMILVAKNDAPLECIEIDMPL